jgi:hypothetical protein
MKAEVDIFSVPRSMQRLTLAPLLCSLHHSSVPAPLSYPAAFDIAHRRHTTHTVAVLSTMLLSCKRLWFARRGPALLAWARARRPDMRPTVGALHEIQVYVKAYVLQAQKNKNTGNLRHSIASKHQRVPIPFTDPKDHSDRAPLHLQRPSVPPYSRRDSPQPPGEL